MEIHEEFTAWAVERGVKINGVAAHKFEGRGLGIIATKKHEANSTVVTVPISALRTIHTVPKALSKAIGPITVHGLLAADFCLSNRADLAPWHAVLPTWDDFLHSVPLLWPSSLQDLLPSACISLLENQQRKLALDWAAVSTACPDLDYNTYLHAWLLINTRTFYFVSPAAKTTPASRDDCMALNPFADYFNHTSFPAPTNPSDPAPTTNSLHPSPCDVSFTTAGYTITTSAPVKKGEEIYISYGNHSNDFLLTEYGFILPSTPHPNHWDEVPLDAYILPLFSCTQKDKLSELGFLGKYVLDPREVCYRTQTALRVLCMPIGRWQRIAEGFDDGEKYQEEVNQILLKALNTYLKDAKKSLKAVEAAEEGLEDQRHLLARRWKQIRILLQVTIDRIQG